MIEETTSLVQERSRDPVLLTWYRFIRVLRKITSQMDEPIRKLNVSRYQFDLLMQVALEEGINQQTCAQRMNVTKGNITQHLDRLEKQGLVQRQKQGRTNHLYLTEKGTDLVDGIGKMFEKIEGSCSLLLLNRDGIYAARDRCGYTPLIIGQREDAIAVTYESCALPNNDFKIVKYLEPGEIGRDCVGSIRISQQGDAVILPDHPQHSP